MRQGIALAMFSLALYLYQSQKRAPEQVAPPTSASPTVAPSRPVDPARPGPRDVYVAKQALDPALLSRLTTDLVELRPIPESVPLPDAGLLVRTPEQLQGKVLVQPVAQGEILLRTRFGDARSETLQKKLRDVIPNGLRAITVETDAVTGSAGFIAQGDIVDVIASYTAAGKQLTRIVLQNVEVLARGNEYRSSNRPSGERVVRGDGGGGILFTLRVSPAMAVKLAHMVDERGFNRFRLVLKNRDDKGEFRSVGTRLADVLSDRPRPLASPGQRADESPEVEVLRGAQSTRESSEERTAGAPPGAGGASPAPDAPRSNDPEAIFDKIAPVNPDPLPPPPPPEELRDDSPPAAP